MTKKIVIHGFYGEGNLGDEVILKALLAEFRKFPGVEISVLSRNPLIVARDHKVNSVGSRMNAGIYKAVREIKKCDLFILGGGGLLKDYGANSLNLFRWLVYLKIAQWLKVKTALCFIGVENIRYEMSKKILPWVLNKADYISVRDSASGDILSDVGVRKDIKVMTDPAVLIGDQGREAPAYHDVRPKVLICLRHWFDKGFYIEDPDMNENLIMSLAAAADLLIEKHGAEIEFVPMRTVPYDDDRAVADSVISRMKDKNKVTKREEVPDIDEFMGMLESSYMVIGMRLHSLILATSAGVPVIGLEYMPKIRAYMDSVGLGDLSVGMADVTGDKLTRAIEKIFSDREKLSDTIRSKVSCARRSAGEGMQDIRGLLG